MYCANYESLQIILRSNSHKNFISLGADCLCMSLAIVSPTLKRLS